MEIHAPGAAGNPSLRVLLVDSDRLARERMRELLEGDALLVECGHSLAGLGPESLGFRPHLVLAALPAGDDAAAMVRNLRSVPALAGAALLIVAGVDDEQARYQAIAAGADDFLVGDVPAAILLATVRARIARAHAPEPLSPMAIELQPRSGQLRRGEFIEQLALAFQKTAEPWQVLIAVSVDQARPLVESLGQAGAFELEQGIAVRFEQILRKDDAQTLWMEFGFGILASRGSREEVEALAQAICQDATRDPFLVRGQQFMLTVSVGVALAPAGTDAGGPNRWFAAAYAAKSIASRLGGNRYDGVLTREYGEMPSERVLIVREWAKEAVAGDNVMVEFQPVLPLSPELAGLYLVDTMLRDFRAPLAGVKRREFLKLARAAGALTMIDRMSLFHAFEAIEQERAQGRMTRLLVPLDLAATENQWLWLEAEVRRRKAHADGLIVEFDAGSALEHPELGKLVQRFEDLGLRIGISDESGDAQRIHRLRRLPASFLRLPVSAIDGISAQAFGDIARAWHENGRAIIADKVEDPACVPRLLAMKVDYLLGDALAASGPRLDYEFTPP